MTAESGLLQSDTDLPLVVESEAATTEHAPAALRVLAAMGALAVADMLGLGEVTC